jgi:two-component system response regulator FixJ
MNRKTVFIVDDNDDFRHSIAWMLRGEGHQTVEFGCAGKAINALRAAPASELACACLLLDVRMPGMTGPEFHDVINREKIEVPIVYMTGHADVAMAVEAMRKGAVSLLEKPLQNDQLSRALESAFTADRQATIGTRALHDRNGNTGNDVFAERVEKLTPRELEVMDCIVDGKANKLIAYEFGISVRTVEVHRARLMKKLGTRNASELVKMVLTCRQS